MDPLRRAARRTPGAPAVLAAEHPGSGGARRSWSFSELDEKVDAVSSALVHAGLRSGDLVAMRLPPSPEAVVLFHAVARSGGVLLPLNPSWTQEELDAGVRAAGPPRLYVDDARQIAEWMANGELRGGSGGPLPRLSLGDPAVVVLTSGSTGSPKPVSLTHGNLEASAGRVIERLDLRAEDGWLTSLSLAHIGGLTLVHRAAAVGCRLITCPRFDPARTSRLIEDGAVTHASLVPVMLSRLIAERGDRPAPQSLRCLLVGGAAAPPALVREALALGYPIALTYGLTEATSQVATARPELVRRKPGTVGKPLGGLELQAGAQDGAPAEIRVRGPTVPRPFVAEGAQSTGSPGIDASGPPVRVDAEGWLHTGDLGYLDAEGDLWITGRLSDRIVTGGVTVEPAEVEAVLAGHPAVREVAVVGVPDPEWGERLAAVVVPRDEAHAPSLDELLDFSRSRLSGAKRPRELRLVASLPRNANGKVDRARLRDA